MVRRTDTDHRRRRLHGHTQGDGWGDAVGRLLIVVSTVTSYTHRPPTTGHNKGERWYGTGALVRYRYHTDVSDEGAGGSLLGREAETETTQSVGHTGDTEWGEGGGCGAVRRAWGWRSSPTLVSCAVSEDWKDRSGLCILSVKGW